MNPVLYAYIFLGLSFIALWLSKKSKLWLNLFYISATCGLLLGNITYAGAIFLFFFSWLVWAFYNRQLEKEAKLVAGWLIFFISMALFAHKIPGFNNTLFFKEVRFSDNTIPYNMYLNFDKPVVGLFILAFGLPLIDNFKDFFTMFFKTAFLYVFPAIAVLILLSYLLGFIEYDYKVPDRALVYVLSNLLFTCTAEEAFFRGFCQKNLQNYLAEKKKNELFAVTVVAALFSICHYVGGWKYMLLSFVAGTFYGVAYFKTKRIEASIMVHFGANAVHFFYFSYPALLHH
jgi:CAAX protease family protein